MARKLQERGFVRMTSDPQLYRHTRNGALVSIHADGSLVTAARADMKEIQDIMSDAMIIEWGDEIQQG
eukprot:10467458-Heterocapsa_arctica.AAC.1